MVEQTFPSMGPLSRFMSRRMRVPALNCEACVLRDERSLVPSQCTVILDLFLWGFEF